MLFLKTERQPREEDRRGREGKRNSNSEGTCLRLKTRHLGRYSESPTTWMLVHSIGCRLPELHSNEPGRWEAASTHESSLLNPSSASPQPSLANTTTAPAHRNIDRSSPTRGQSGRDSQRRQDLGETSDRANAEQSHQVLFQQKQFRTVPWSGHGSCFP